MSQYQYLVDRYSQSLTKYDVQELFERLKEAKGNITAATREVDIQRKTVYDWENSSEDIKTSTKRKILEASFDNDLYGTMEFLVRKNAMNYQEILERYISTYCDRIISTNETQQFQRRIVNFERFIKSHIGAIHDIKTIPIEEMIASINRKSDSLEVNGIAKDLGFLSTQGLSQRFIHLLEIFSTKTMFQDEIAQKLDLPEEFVDRACKATSYFGPASGLDEDVSRIAMARIGTTNVGGKNLQLDYVLARRK